MYWGNFNLMHQLNQNIVQLFSERTFFFHQSIFFWKINFIRMFSVQQSIFMDLGNSSLEAEVFSTYFELWLFDFFWRKKFLQILFFCLRLFSNGFHQQRNHLDAISLFINCVTILVLNKIEKVNVYFCSVILLSTVKIVWRRIQCSWEVYGAVLYYYIKVYL